MLILALMGLAGIACGAAVCFIAAAVGRRDRTATLFGAISMGMAAYAALEALVFSSSDIAWTCDLLRIQGVAVAGIMATVPWFGAAFVRRPAGGIGIAISCGYGLLAIWSIISPSGYWFRSVTHLDAVTLPWGEVISVPRGPLSPTYGFSAILQYPLYVRLLLDTRWLRRQGRIRDAWLWQVSIGLLLLSVIHDHGVDLGLWSSPYLTEWVFLAFLLIMGLRISQQAGIAQRELARLNRDVAERESLYRGVYAAAGDAILVIDRDRIVDHNARAEEIFGVPPRDLIGRSVIALSPPEQASGPSEAEANRRIDRALAGSREFFEWRHIRLDGSEFDTEVTLVAVDLPAGRRLVAVVRDVSEQRRLRARLAQAQKMESLGRLASGLSHDFNNMLQGIVGNIEMLEPGLTDEADLSFVRNALRQCRQAGDLLDRLLDFSRRESVDRVVTDLNGIAEDALRLARPALRGLDVGCRLSDQSLLVRGHAGLLTNVFLNLFLNARDATPDGGQLTIATAAVHRETALAAFGLTQPKPPGWYALVTVRDDGEGMGPAVLARCFEPFFSTKGERGTGLGLATVFGTVNAHEGGITVESSPGHGTTFEVWLPLATDAVPLPLVRSALDCLDKVD